MKMKCPCGLDISRNTMPAHIRGRTCSLSLDEKARVLEIITLKKRHTFAWRLQLGLEAVADTHWWVHCIEYATKLSDWSFIPPRGPGCIRPSSRTAMKRNRIGTKNPAHIDLGYVDAEIQAFARDYYAKHLDNPQFKMRDILTHTERKFPKWRYQIVGIPPYMIGPWLLGVSLSAWTVLAQKHRGKFISAGLKRSSKIHPAWTSLTPRVSQAHQRLFEMVQEQFPDAIMEFRIPVGKTWKSFDICVPSARTLIEMHGRVFHELSNTTSAPLRKMQERNVANDFMKHTLATEHGYHLLICWDDEESQWSKQLEVLHENKESQKSRRDAGF